MLSSVFISFLACESREKTWSKKELQAVIDDAEEIGSFALLVQTDEEIVASFGDFDNLSRVHSVRKAIISALVLQQLDKINLERLVMLLAKTRQ